MNTQMPGGEAPGGQMPGAPGGGAAGRGMPGAPGAPAPEKAGGTAIASLVLSVLGVFCGITAIIGIILGAVELNKIKRGESSQKGRGLAIAGVVIGAIVLTGSIILTLISLATGGFSFEVTT